MKPILTILFSLFYLFAFSQSFNERVNSNLGVSIKFPGNPQYSVNRDPNVGTYNYTYNLSWGGSNFVFQINQLVTHVSEQGLVDGKEVLIRNFLQGVNGRIINSQVSFHKNRRCVDFSFSTSAPSYRINKTRAFVYRDHLIMVSYNSEDFNVRMFNEFVNTIHFPGE